MKSITEAVEKRQQLPIKVIQFGEGNFLRAFADYMLDIANEKGVFGGGIAIIKPIPHGSLERFRAQDNLYTVALRGRQNGETVNTSRLITSVSRTLDCFADYDEYMSLARLEGLRFVISNTTEAGIVLDKNDSFEGLPASYPGKLTKFLYERYNAFGGDREKGLIILPVELIENNGARLLECVNALCRIWGLPEDFCKWINEGCVFCSTLVDRIVTGYPSAEAESICESLGYSDLLLDVGEPFGLWVIESGKDISGELPLDKIGLPVVFTNDLTPYRERKVRVLNGAHTASVLIGWLAGLNIVRDCMNDRVMGCFIRRVVNEEIVPQVALPQKEVEEFAQSVFERFQNPFIDHSLLAISLNSVSKWKARVLPSFKDCYKNNGALPPMLTFSFAALLAFYTSSELRDGALHASRADGTEYAVRDDAAVLEFFARESIKPIDEFVGAVCRNTDFWGEDMSLYEGFVQSVCGYLADIRADAAEAVRKIAGC